MRYLTQIIELCPGENPFPIRLPGRHLTWVRPDRKQNKVCMQVIFQPGIIGNRDGMRASKLTGAGDNFDPGGGKGSFDIGGLLMR